jgi:hypothetical protein
MSRVVQKLLQKFSYLVYRLVVKNRDELMAVQIVSLVKDKRYIRNLWMNICNLAQIEAYCKNQRIKVHPYFRIIALLQKSILTKIFLENATFSSLSRSVHNKIKHRILRRDKHRILRREQTFQAPSHLNFSLFFLNKNFRDR